ncbi:MAG TPA: GNAT family N-acetyltransferase [Candidatus Moranbacteria bacterium]|nr:GNAT family N-acetyltransferase [Candidatus Moranbacteria bacterium]
MEIKKIDNNNAPYELLLSADPSRENIGRYLKKGNCFAAFGGNNIIGIYILAGKNSNTLEIMNIAVMEDERGKGIGKLLIVDAIKRAKKEGAKKLIVGTGNSSISQLAFYQKCGFRISGIKKDFFIKNYKNLIFEDGIQCKDMIMLEVAL